MVNMSVLSAFKNGWLLSHEDFIRRHYESVQGTPNKLTFDPRVFEINTPFVRTSCSVGFINHESSSEPSKTKSKKRKRITPDMKEVTFVKQNVDEAVDLLKKKGFFDYIPSPSDIEENNSIAREVANCFYLNNISQTSRFHGSNVTQESLIAEIDNKRFVLPAACRFVCYNVEDISSKMDLMTPPYDLVLLDPPWWNKYIRRKRKMCEAESYQMQYNEVLTTIPMADLTLPGSLIAVWCTNSPSHFTCLCDVIFPAWDVEYVSKWFWIKVTRGGKPVCHFSPPPGKQPFERIVFGCRKGAKRVQPLPEADKLIISVPSAIHSHKPPLADVLAPYLPENPRCLELFARYLLPGWTSLGNEVLKLQHLSLYKENENRVNWTEEVRNSSRISS